jgi:hypothetical protein
MRKLLLLLALIGLVPAPLLATANGSSLDVTLDRATAWRSRSKPGRITAEGTLRAVGGPFDMTQFVVTVKDGQDLDEAGAFTACRVFPAGTVRCQNDDGTARIRYIPDALDATLYRYKLEYRRRNITKPQVPPLEIEFDYAGSLRASAKNEPCRVFIHKIECKGTSTSPATCPCENLTTPGAAWDDTFPGVNCAYGLCGPPSIPSRQFECIFYQSAGPAICELRVGTDGDANTCEVHCSQPGPRIANLTPAEVAACYESIKAKASATGNTCTAF